MIKLFSSILLGFRENPKLGSAIAKNSRIHECLLVMLIILRLSTNASTSTHTNCLIQLLKSVSMGPKVSTEAAHSTPPIPLVKHQLNDFFVSAQSLTTATRTSRISQREANHTALNHTVNLASTSSPPPLADPSQPNYSSNLLILKEFSAAPRCEVGRIIGAPFLPSTAFCSFLTKTVVACFSSLLPRQAHGKSLGQRGDGKTGVDPDVGRNGTAIHHIQPRITKHQIGRAHV